MMYTYKVMLLPNNKQQTRLFQTAGAVRFAYNWAIDYEYQNYKNDEKYVSDGALRKIFTQLKQQDDYMWLNSVSNEALKQAIKDACNAYIRYLKGVTDRPRFKSKHKWLPKFYARYDNIEFTQSHVRLEKIATNMKPNHRHLNWVKLAEKNRIPQGVKYYNPRITFDGLHWWISVGVEKAENAEKPMNDGIGIDLGIKDLAICSDEVTYKNINKSPKVKKLKKKLRREQRKISRKMNADIICYKQVGDKRYPMFDMPLEQCRNYQKQKLTILKIHQRLSNIRQNYLQQTTTEIVNRKPKFIVLEDLNVRGMTKNRHLAKAIQEQGLYEFRRIMTYKCEWNNIQLIIADRFFPSSKTCSCCGVINRNLKLRDRTFVCPECGFEINRDYQAALNLQNYGQKLANKREGEVLLAG